MKTASEVCKAIKMQKLKENQGNFLDFINLLVRRGGKVELSPLDCQYFRGAFNNQEFLKSNGFVVEVSEEVWTTGFLFWKQIHSRPLITVSACCGEEK